MEEVYRIGKHEFATREEWEGAKRDLEMIEAILNRVDVDRPEDVETIYQLIHEGKIQFESKLGTAFFCDVSDRTAQNLKRKLKSNKQEWTREWNAHRRLLGQKEFPVAGRIAERQSIDETRQSQMFKFLGLACAALAAICIFFYSHSVYLENKSVRKLEEVQQKKSVSQAVDWSKERIENDGTQQAGAGAPAAEPSETPFETQAPPEVLAEYVSLHTQYPDLAGWVRIPDTKVDLPVMQSKDNDYYLHRNIDGTEDINGTLFLDYRANLQKQSANYIIYGHNMKSGEMFGGLKQYLEEPYLSQHDKIQFDTIYEKQTYQIVAVCLTDVGNQTEESYRYYDFIEAESDADIEAFLQNIRSCAVIDKTQDVTVNDKFLTLSTCNSYVEDGRLYLVAKKL